MFPKSQLLKLSMYRKVQLSDEALGGSAWCGMLNAKQVEQYSKQIDGFTANVSAKMFAVRGNLLPE